MNLLRDDFQDLGERSEYVSLQSQGNPISAQHHPIRDRVSDPSTFLGKLHLILSPYISFPHGTHHHLTYVFIC